MTSSRPLIAQTSPPPCEDWSGWEACLIGPAATKVELAGCLIDQAAARLKSGSCLTYLDLGLCEVYYLPYLTFVPSLPSVLSSQKCTFCTWCDHMCPRHLHPVWPSLSSHLNCILVCWHLSKMCHHNEEKCLVCRLLSLLADLHIIFAGFRPRRLIWQ